MAGPLCVCVAGGREGKGPARSGICKKKLHYYRTFPLGGGWQNPCPLRIVKKWGNLEIPEIIVSIKLIFVHTSGGDMK